MASSMYSSSPLGGVFDRKINVGALLKANDITFDVSLSVFREHSPFCLGLHAFIFFATKRVDNSLRVESDNDPTLFQSFAMRWHAGT